MRLDELARWLQDLAYADLVDAGLGEVGFWIVRRTRMRIARFPRFPSELRLQTFCSGISSLAAERRTTITGPDAAVEAVSLWVNLDPSSRRPARLPERFLAAYGAAAAGRRARGRLRHPPPSVDARAGGWSFRVADLDVAGHVNNATYWEILEEGLEADVEGGVDGEIEYRAAAPAGAATVLRAGERTWVTDGAVEVYASARLVVEPADAGG